MHDVKAGGSTPENTAVWRGPGQAMGGRPPMAQRPGLPPVPSVPQVPIHDAARPALLSLRPAARSQ